MIGERDGPGMDRRPAARAHGLPARAPGGRRVRRLRRLPSRRRLTRIVLAGSGRVERHDVDPLGIDVEDDDLPALERRALGEPRRDFVVHPCAGGRRDLQSERREIADTARAEDLGADTVRAAALGPRIEKHPE